MTTINSPDEGGDETNNPNDNSPTETLRCTDNKLFRFFFCPDLTMKTIYGVILGFGIGAGIANYQIDPTIIAILGYPGELFVNSLKMVVIPMIICDMILAIIKLGDIRKIKLIGKRALTYYLSTTFFACIEGLIWVTIFQPGASQGKKIAENITSVNSLFNEACQIIVPGTNNHVKCYPKPTSKRPEDAFLDLGRTLVPPNIMVAFSDFNILGLMFFVVLYAFYVAKEEKGGLVKDFFEVSSNAFKSIVMKIIWFTPLGIFSLIIKTVLKEENLWEELESLGSFVGVTILGILVHMFIFYPTAYYLTTRKNPYKLLPKMTAPMMTALATSSSAATLPVTIKTAERNGVHRDISRFMLPLGATINMDGTALNYPISVIYLANLMNIHLTAGNMIAVSITSAMISIGAAPIPSAGLVYLILIMETVGLPIRGSISFVLSVDWLLDRMQTICNVTGDGIGASILEHYRSKDANQNIIGGLCSDAELLEPVYIQKSDQKGQMRE